VSNLPYVDGYIDLEGVRVFHRCWVETPVDTLIVALHGLCDHSGRYEHVGQELARLGASMCMTDLRGHGRTAVGEDRGYIESFNDFLVDLEAFLKYLNNLYTPRRIVLMGYDLGGLIALHYIARVRRFVRGQVLIAPALSYTQGFPSMLGFRSRRSPRAAMDPPIDFRKLSVDPSVAKSFIDDPYTLKKVSARMLYEISRAMKDLPKYLNAVANPTLVIHGERDQIVPPRASSDLVKRLRTPVKELRIEPGAGHAILHEPPWKEIVTYIATWIRERIPH